MGKKYFSKPGDDKTQVKACAEPHFPARSTRASSEEIELMLFELECLEILRGDPPEPMRRYSHDEGRLYVGPHESEAMRRHLDHREHHNPNDGEFNGHTTTKFHIGRSTA